MECENFTLSKPVGSCGTRIWLGTNAAVNPNDILFVKYYLGGNEVVKATTPIVEGTNVFLDLTDPDADFYNNHINAYYVWLSDAYLSDYMQITNDGIQHDGFILIFSGNTTQDRVIV